MFLHIDLDAFFPSAEKARNKDLENRPVVVCMFTKNGKGGAVASASYEARAFGIKAGMPVSRAKALASQDTVFLQADVNYYSFLSREIMHEIAKFGKLEIISIDEAYMEINDFNEARELAVKIKSIIKEKFKISVTVGIGKTRILAKIASKISKPDGLKAIFSLMDVGNYEITVIPGIGKKTAEILNKYGIIKINDLINLGTMKIKEIFPNKYGDYLSLIISDNEASIKFRKKEKQKGKFITLDNETEDKNVIYKNALVLLEKILEEKKEELFSSISLVLVKSDMKNLVKTRKVKPTRNKEMLSNLMKEMINEAVIDKPIRRIGLFLSDFVKVNQKSLTDF